MTCHFDEAPWGGWTAEAVITHAWYAHAVRRAGGRVVFVPPDPDGDDIVDREDPTRTFWLGVQWHPEQPEQPSGPLLFGALV